MAAELGGGLEHDVHSGTTLHGDDAAQQDYPVRVAGESQGILVLMIPAPVIHRERQIKLPCS